MNLSSLESSISCWTLGEGFNVSRLWFSPLQNVPVESRGAYAQKGFLCWLAQARCKSRLMREHCKILPVELILTTFLAGLRVK